MIHVHYRGQLGNNLFQFAFGAVISHLSGQAMAALPITGFPGTSGFARPSATSGDRIPRHGYHMNIAEWAERAKARDIIVHSYPHNSSYYEPHHGWLAPLLAPAPGDYAQADNDEIVLHLRLGDYFSSHRNRNRFGYPVEAIFKLVAQLDYKRCLIVTDTPRHQAVERLVREHCGLLVASNRDHDYRTLFHARRLIMSPSTFSWWAAWSGHATEIYFPREMGYWQSKYNCALAISRPNFRRYNAEGKVLLES